MPAGRAAAFGATATVVGAYALQEADRETLGFTHKASYVRRTRHVLVKRERDRRRSARELAVAYVPLAFRLAFAVVVSPRRRLRAAAASRSSPGSTSSIAKALPRPPTRGGCSGRRGAARSWASADASCAVLTNYEYTTLTGTPARGARRGRAPPPSQGGGAVMSVAHTSSASPASRGPQPRVS